MKSFDVVKTALANTLRSKLRTFLTVIAIVIGAFTLTLTSGLGAGISQTMDRIVDGFGQADEIYVQPQMSMDAMEGSDGPQEYDPTAGDDPFGGMMGGSVLTNADIETIEGIEHITGVDPMLFIDVDYLEAPDGDQYALNLEFSGNDYGLELVAGEIPDRSAMEITIPEDWLTVFGTEDPEEVLGQTVQIGASNATGQQSTVEAEIVGVSEPTLAGVGFQPLPSQALTEEINEINSEGYEGQQEDSYIMVAAQVDNLEENEDAIKSALADEGLLGMTLEDQISQFQAVIDAVTWVLSGFALIALLAASFGIVNTLLMSVQERTREIGLMKALGMPGSKVFGLFSMEAVMIGIMGSVIGVAGGLGLGFIGDLLLTGSEDAPLGGFVELSLFGLNPLALVGIFLLIVVIAFLAGTLPAVRAAKKDPIEALRYE